MGLKIYIGFVICLLISGLTESDSSPDGAWIGIHLGTIYSSAAVYNPPSSYYPARRNRNNSMEISRGTIEIIKDEPLGRITIPTWTIFADPTNPLIDDGAAKYLATLASQGVVIDVNRLIGKKFDDPEVQDALMSSSPYYQVVNVDNKPYIQLKADDGETKLFSPDVIVAMILRKMKAIAEMQLGQEVKGAVIVVPNYFTREQMDHTRSVAELAGLQQYRVIIHSLASLWAYGFIENPPLGDCNIMIYNLGGYSGDVSIITGSESDGRWAFWETVASKQVNLGGESFNRRMVDYFIQLIKTKYGKDISSDGEALRKLNSKCEEAKRALSTQDTVEVELHSLGGIDDNSTEILTRDKFEQLNIDFFNKTIAVSEKVLADAGLEVKDIHHVLLTGGSTHIPKIRSMVNDLFQGKSPMNPKDFHPFHVFPYGAAVKAGFEHRYNYTVATMYNKWAN